MKLFDINATIARDGIRCICLPYACSTAPLEWAVCRSPYTAATAYLSMQTGPRVPDGPHTVGLIGVLQRSKGSCGAHVVYSGHQLLCSHQQSPAQVLDQAEAIYEQAKLLHSHSEAIILFSNKKNLLVASRTMSVVSSNFCGNNTSFNSAMEGVHDTHRKEI